MLGTVETTGQSEPPQDLVAVLGRLIPTGSRLGAPGAETWPQLCLSPNPQPSAQHIIGTSQIHLKTWQPK